MKKFKLNSFLLVVLLLGAQFSYAQGSFSGIISADEDGAITPLEGVNVYWLGTTTGSLTDSEGAFEMPFSDKSKTLVIRHLNYASDTLDVLSGNYLEHTLIEAVELKGVTVEHRKKSTASSFIDPIRVQNISEKELQKAACCNLSESFETSPSVDVSFTDAVTGTRQILMLGLAGPYTQITRENMPEIRGLAAVNGLTYVPGTWIESIQLNKGAGSVVNGFESIAGQINTELRKPEDADRLYLNIYANEGGRFEGNLNLAQQLQNDKWSTATLLHGKINRFKWDRNEDGFLDNPISDHFIALNRWKYYGNKGFRMQLGVKGSYIDNIGGQKDFDRDEDALGTDKWGMHMRVTRFEGWGKFGKVFDSAPWKSFGLQVSASGHSQDSYYGTRAYDAKQQSAYANFVYQSIIGNTNHEFKTGMSFQYDHTDEQFANEVYDRVESVPGAYFEYTYNHLDKFNLVAGLRGDLHNEFGAFYTARMHMRYALSESTVLRASAGRGQRSANIFAEYGGLLASSREIIIKGDGTDKPFGLEPEIAWNYGVNISHCFKIGDKEGTLSADFYRTDFINQVVADLDISPQQAYFYNLKGKSFANSAQVQLDYELFTRFDMRLAYRWYDVRTEYSKGLLRKPLLASHRAFMNLAYATTNSWKFDYTISWQSNKRIPTTATNPEQYQLASKSPGFVVMNAQVSKNWREKFEIYAGVENISNYTQDNPILASDQPFSDYFDSSLVWGPIFGRKTYFGLRYWIK